jgi:hypothetical protein
VLSWLWVRVATSPPLCAPHQASYFPMGKVKIGSIHSALPALQRKS